MKNKVKSKLLIILIPVIIFIIIFFIFFIIIIGFIIGDSIIEEQINNMKVQSSVINNQLYADRYKELLNKHMMSKGYVSLERIVFYLQVTHNILDVSTLSYEDWENAYLENCDNEEKQMIPIKIVCQNLNNQLLLTNYTVESGYNKDNVQIDALNLCIDNGEDVITSDKYNDFFLPLPFKFPLKEKFTITSIVFENRDVDLDLSEKDQERVNFHSGWDFAVPIGTNFYSICDGKVTNITNSQDNDLPYDKSKNSIGNYMKVKCDNGFTAIYRHLQYNSQPNNVILESRVAKGDLLGRTSTTGESTGAHLHLGLEDETGGLLDAMAYINLKDYEEELN